ncbi:ABC transporter ATP-binding protein [Paraburkholderia acidisoli]|uniref:Dipeptide ABC transporter ATP-binding protein n=1 Tax=Paraburkholderia acidisoli TaxID=2571748 RepID=A0A7Z2GPB9_9BURK|nr:ABC transporter ATP-binding protein [Paraburkholderia acidisoli]QGZ65460.1 dipeptide ABC transporter ATP-binding protein [Paraburkholderia acidisoli]
MTTLLDVRHLTVALPAGADRAHALRDVSFTLDAGELLCMVGESGSGKSMTAGALLGLLPEGVTVAGGALRWQNDTDLLTLPRAELRRWRGSRIGMIFQEPMTALNPLRTIGDQIAEVFRTHTRLGRAPIRARTLDLLDAVQIPDPAQTLRRYPHELSGGQRQRAMIAMALALEPQLLIADEPTTALDVTTQAQILHLIRDLQRRNGTAVLFITHDFGVVAEIADRIAVMRQGELVELGAASDVLNRPRHVYTQTLIDAVPPLPSHESTQAAPAARAATPAVEDKPAILNVHAVSKTYRSRVRRAVRTAALRDVSFALARGSTLGIVGESGSGKSTLARTLMGLLAPDAGSIDYDGDDLAQRAKSSAQRAHRLGVQMVFQDPYGSLNPRRTVGDIVTQGPIAQGVSREAAYARARELFALVGLAPDALARFPHEFSGGQRQRVGLARALALDPKVLVADEPVSALDVSVQAQVLRLLAQLKADLGLSMLFITHDLRVAAQLCDHIAVMKDGEIVEYGAARDVFVAPRHAYTRALLDAVPGRAWNPPKRDAETEPALVLATG